MENGRFAGPKAGYRHKIPPVLVPVGQKIQGVLDGVDPLPCKGLGELRPDAFDETHGGLKVFQVHRFPQRLL